MQKFIKNNKEILVTLFCVWIGVTFTLISIKLSSIDKKLGALNELANINFNLDSNLGELGGIRDLEYLKDINDTMTSTYRQARLRDLGL